MRKLLIRRPCNIRALPHRAAARRRSLSHGAGAESAGAGHAAPRSVCRGARARRLGDNQQYTSPLLGRFTVLASNEGLRFRWGVLDGLLEVFDAPTDRHSRPSVQRKSHTFRCFSSVPLTSSPAVRNIATIPNVASRLRVVSCVNTPLADAAAPSRKLVIALGSRKRCSARGTMKSANSSKMYVRSFRTVSLEQARRTREPDAGVSSDPAHLTENRNRPAATGAESR